MRLYLGGGVDVLVVGPVTHQLISNKTENQNNIMNKSFCFLWHDFIVVFDDCFLEKNLCMSGNLTGI